MTTFREGEECWDDYELAVIDYLKDLENPPLSFTETVELLLRKFSHVGVEDARKHAVNTWSTLLKHHYYLMEEDGVLKLYT